MQGCVIQVILMRSLQYALCLYHNNNGGSTLLRAVGTRGEGGEHSLEENSRRPLISSRLKIQFVELDFSNLIFDFFKNQVQMDRANDYKKNTL